MSGSRMPDGYGITFINDTDLEMAVMGYNLMQISDGIPSLGGRNGRNTVLLIVINSGLYN